MFLENWKNLDHILGYFVNVKFYGCDNEMVCRRMSLFLGNA